MHLELNNESSIYINEAEIAAAYVSPKYILSKEDLSKQKINKTHPYHKTFIIKHYTQNTYCQSKDGLYPVYLLVNFLRETERSYFITSYNNKYQNPISFRYPVPTSQNELLLEYNIEEWFYQSLEKGEVISVQAVVIKYQKTEQVLNMSFDDHAKAEPSPEEENIKEPHEVKYNPCIPHEDNKEDISNKDKVLKEDFFKKLSLLDKKDLLEFICVLSGDTLGYSTLLNKGILTRTYEGKEVTSLSILHDKTGFIISKDMIEYCERSYWYFVHQFNDHTDYDTILRNKNKYLDCAKKIIDIYNHGIEPNENWLIDVLKRYFL